MAYGIKYKCAFGSIKGNKYKIYILKKDYNSAQIDMRMGGTPVEINYTNNSENKFEIIRGSECILNIFSEYDGQFTEIMTADAKEFQVQIWKNDTLHWQGYVIQDNYSEPFVSAPYLISLRATDGLGDLKLMDFADGNGTVYLGDLTFAEAILNCLGTLKNGTQLITSNDIFESRIDRNSLKNEAFNNLTVNPFIFLENDLNALKCDEVLKMVLELFQCYIYYKEGKYFVERVNYKINEVITRRTYNINFEGIQDATNPIVSTENIRKSISKTGDLIFIGGDHNSSYVPAYNKVEINSEIQDPSNLLPNNYFRFWDTGSTIPVSWNKSGNISIAKRAFPKSGDAIFISTKAEDNAISYSTNMVFPIRNAYQGVLTDNSNDELSMKIGYAGNLRFMVKATTPSGVYYLYCERNTDEVTKIEYRAEFKNTPAMCKLPAPSGGRVNENRESWFSVELSATIPDGTTKLDFGIMPSFTMPNYNADCLVREFTPTIKAGSSARSYGDNFSITSNKNVKETYDELQPSLGEFDNIGLTNQILIKTASAKLPTANWYREGKTESKPLFQLATQSILNQYRQPFRLFSGSFQGEFDYGKVYEIQTLTGFYLPYKSNTNLKMDEHRIDFFELLDDSEVASDKYVKMVNYKDGEYTTRNNAVVNGARPVRGGGRN
ncbi:hypothetical protein [Pedobacter sp.]|uniref:hypothetical protein n=1 Tax=Pedobacter sp. TaxID=1411316 RepID=UPI003D7FCCEA